MTTFGVFAYLLALFVLGWFMLGFFHEALGSIERIGLAYPFGAGIFSWVVFLAANIGMPITLASASLVCIILLILCLGFAWRWKGSFISVAIHRPDVNVTQIVLIGIIGILICTTFAASIYMPLHAWDSLAIWGLKAKLIAATGKIAPQAQAAWPLYPLNIPIQMTFLFLLGGDFLQIIFPIYFLSLILLFYANLRQWVGTTLGLACTLFLGATPIIQYQAAIAYANLPFAFYYVTSTLYLLRFLRDKKTQWLLLSGILMGFAGWTRTESVLYLGINVAILLLFTKFHRESLKQAIFYIGAYIIFWIPWTVYCKLAGYGDYISNAAYGGLINVISGNLSTSLLGQILSYAGAHAQATNIWGYLWIGLLVALVLGIKHLREHASLLLLLILNFGGLIYSYYSAGITSSDSIEWWLNTGFDRMALHWAPLAVFYLGLTIETAGLPKVNMFTFLKRTDKYLILLVLFSIFAIGPLLAPGYFWGAHDGRHSVYFLFEFDRSIQDGIWYPRWAPDYTFGYGYPMFNIYAPGALYVSEFFHLIGFDFVNATKLTFALALLLAGPAMFGLIKRLTGSSSAAFLSGLAYVYIPYHIIDIYVRAALAESVALIFLPLTLWGFYETVLRPSRLSIVATAFVYAGMMFSHNGVTLLFTLVLAVWVLFLILGEIRKSSSSGFSFYVLRFIQLGLPSLAALVLGLGIVSIFFIPAVLEYRFVRTDQWLGNYYDYTNHFVHLFQWFSPTWGFGISNPGPRDDMSFQFGVVPVVLALLSIFAIVKNPNGTRRFWVFFLAMTGVVAFLMLGASLPIWQVLPIVTFAQFPWRLLVLTTVSLAALAGAIILTEPANGDARTFSLPTVLLGILIVLGSFPYLTAQNIIEPKEGPVSILGLFRFQQSAGEMTGSTSTVKEIPTWSPMADVYFAGRKLRSRIDYTHIDQDKVWIGVLPNFAGLKANSERIAYHAEEDTTITFNIFYYPGWQAYLVKPQTTEIIRTLDTFVNPDDPLGRINVSIPAGREQWLMLRFDDTPPRIIGTWISVASILAAFGLLVWDVRAKQRQKDEG